MVGEKRMRGGIEFHCFTDSNDEDPVPAALGPGSVDRQDSYLPVWYGGRSSVKYRGASPFKAL